MPQAPSQASALTLRLFRIASFATGIFLLLISVLYAIRLITSQDLWALGPNGFLTLESFRMEDGFRVGLPESGLDLTVISLIVHGWLYVFYLYTNFRLWSEMRWKFIRFIWMALGGIVPFWSFFSERRFSDLAGDARVKASQLPNW